MAGSTAMDTFDCWRQRIAAGLSQSRLRRLAFALLAAGAGLLPLMAGAAQATLAKVPTDGADTLLMLIGSAMVLLMKMAPTTWMATVTSPRCGGPIRLERTAVIRVMPIE